MNMQATRKALEKLEAGCSPEDAKAICEPEVLRQIFKWKVPISPIINFCSRFFSISSNKI